MHACTRTVYTYEKSEFNANGHEPSGMTDRPIDNDSGGSMMQNVLYNWCVCTFSHLID